jgi:hypothetical protein
MDVQQLKLLAGRVRGVSTRSAEPLIYSTRGASRKYSAGGSAVDGMASDGLARNKVYVKMN